MFSAVESSSNFNLYVFRSSSNRRGAELQRSRREIGDPSKPLFKLPVRCVLKNNTRKIVFPAINP
jgi:hypothetical protein